MPLVDSHGDDDFLQRIAFAKAPERFSGIVQGVRPVDNRYDLENASCPSPLGIGPLIAHLYELGSTRGYRLAGLERTER